MSQILVHDNKTHDAVLAKILFQRWIGIYHNLVGRLCTASATCCHALLEHCLGSTDKRVIEATVGGLAPHHVIPFLSRVVAKFEARPARGKLLTTWIQSVIENHASYIVSTPSVLKILSGLHESIDARLGAFKRLLKLSGGAWRFLRCGRLVESSNCRALRRFGWRRVPQSILPCP